MIHTTITAFDKHSSATFQITYTSSKSEEELLEEFEQEVPFTKWYYEIETD